MFPEYLTGVLLALFQKRTTNTSYKNTSHWFTHSQTVI